MYKKHRDALEKLISISENRGKLTIFFSCSLQRKAILVRFLTVKNLAEYRRTCPVRLEAKNTQISSSWNTRQLKYKCYRFFSNQCHHVGNIPIITRILSLLEISVFSVLEYPSSLF